MPQKNVFSTPCPLIPWHLNQPNYLLIRRNFLHFLTVISLNPDPSKPYIPLARRIIEWYASKYWAVIIWSMNEHTARARSVNVRRNYQDPEHDHESIRSAEYLEQRQQRSLHRVLHVRANDLHSCEKFKARSAPIYTNQSCLNHAFLLKFVTFQKVWWILFLLSFITFRKNWWILKLEEYENVWKQILRRCYQQGKCERLNQQIKMRPIYSKRSLVGF